LVTTFGSKRILSSSKRILFGSKGILSDLKRILYGPKRIPSGLKRYLSGLKRIPFGPQGRKNGVNGGESTKISVKEAFPRLHFLGKTTLN
jgi:hypothetical protein